METAVPQDIETLALPADLTVAGTTAVREALLATLDGRPEAVVDGSAVASADGAGVQLLVAWATTAGARGVPWSLLDPSAPLCRVAELLDLAGALELAPSPAPFPDQTDA